MTGHARPSRAAEWALWEERIQARAEQIAYTHGIDWYRDESDEAYRLRRASRVGALDEIRPTLPEWHPWRRT